MIKVIFCLQTMVRGGVEKELITILKKFDLNKYTVKVLLLYQDDVNVISEIPSSIEVINLNVDRDLYFGGTKKNVKARLIQKRYFDAIALILKRIFIKDFLFRNRLFDSIPVIGEKFDIAVCYHIHSDLNMKYVAKKVQATKKIAWIHNDFYTTGYQIQKYNEYLSLYDEFVAVSKKVKEEFVSICPEYAGKTSVAYNILDENEIRESAKIIPNEDSYFDDKRVKILTVGRFTDQKGIDLAIETCNRLKKMELEFCWYVIGWGPEETKYKELINKYSLQDCFVLLGEKSNPYPYIEQCDIYVQPSRHEAWGLVVHEARILYKPIVCTNFAGADEQITDGKTGYIVPVGDIPKLTDKILSLINNEGERTRLKNNLISNLSNENDFTNILSVFE